MARRGADERAALVAAGEPTFSELLVRYLLPFWLFKDASRGDRMTRAAAYRHNRSMRVYLPGYLMRWMLGGAFTFGLTAAFDSMALDAPHQTAPFSFFRLLAAGGGIAFVCCFCMLVVIAYIYLYLSRYEN